MPTEKDKKKETHPLFKTGELATKYCGGITRRDFMVYSAGTVACLYLGSLTSGCSNDVIPQPAGYPIESDVYTTLQKTVQLSQSFSGTIAPENLKNISEYDAKGYGIWLDGGPLGPVKRMDIMSSGYALPANNNPANLLRFFAITDIHITDKESPSQLIYLQQMNQLGFEAGVTSVYSPVMMYTTHVLDAAIQTVNALHKINPIDFGISLGDACNSTQYNELRWYIDVIDGEVIEPGSGAHAGADNIDYQKPFKAAGLDSSIPWYQAIGNHDHFWLGSIPPDGKNGDDSSLRESCISDEIIAMTNTLRDASNIYSFKDPQETKYYMGVLDGATPNGEIIKFGQVENVSTPPRVVADQDRYSLTKTEWVEEFFNTSTEPSGHGFNLAPSDQEEGFACYSFVPKSTIPIKVIVLDNTQREDDGDETIHGRGFLDEARWKWFKNELKAGDEANQLMIIASHIPIGVCPHKSVLGGTDTYVDWFDNSGNPAGMQNAVTLAELIAELHSHPNLIMWIAGHRHVNIVKAFVSDDASAPERGFWHVETSSLHDFPQQMRLFEIRLNSDYTISIVTTNVDPAVKEGTPAWKSRKYAVAAQQIVHTNLAPSFPGADPTLSAGPDPSVEATKASIDPTIGSCNAELLVGLSPAMKAYFQTLFP